MISDDVCVIVPVHNEAPVLGEVLVGLREHFTHIVIVDDGSTDGSAAVARAVGVTVLRHEINLGQGAALQTGFEYALAHPTVRRVVTFDGDGQHDARDAAAMTTAAERDNLDAVLGSRRMGHSVDQPRSRALILRAGVLFSRTTSGLQLTDTHNGLRVLSRRAISSIRLRQQGMAYASELEHSIARLGLSWHEHPVQVRYTAYSRGKGQGNVNAVNIVFDLLLARLRAN